MQSCIMHIVYLSSILGGPLRKDERVAALPQCCSYSRKLTDKLSSCSRPCDGTSSSAGYRIHTSATSSPRPRHPLLREDTIVSVLLLALQLFAR